MFQIHSHLREGQRTLELAGELTIYAVATARRELQAQLEADSGLVLDLQGIQEIDSAGVQLLLWLKRRAVAHGLALVLARPSSAAAELFDLLEVAGDLDLPGLPSPAEA